MSLHNTLYIKNNIEVGNYIQLNDIAEPSNLLNGQGTIYKLTGNDGVWWKPDSAGAPVDLTTGENNTASNVGVGGVSVFKQKNGIDLEFNSINSTTSHITTSLDAGNNEVDLTFDQTQITGTGVLNSGSITSGFGDINNGSSAITSGLATFENLNIDQVNINNSTITFTGATGSNIITAPDNLANALTIAGGTDYIRIDSTNTAEKIDLLERVQFYDYAIFTDITEPTNGPDGEGRLYKKTGSDGLWWKPDSAGPELNLALGGEIDVQQASATTQTSTTSNTYVDLPDMTLTTSNTVAKEYTVIFSGEFESSFSGRDIYIIINVNGVDVAATQRRSTYQSSNAYQNLVAIYKTDPISNGIVIKVRWHYENSKTIKCNNRSLIIEGST